MKQQYNSPILLVMSLNEADVITASSQDVVDDSEGFNLSWIQGFIGGQYE